MSARALLVGALSVFCATPVALAATFTVNTTVDAPDASPGNGVCLTASGTCSLRAAIEESNFDAAIDTIAFNVPGPGVQTFQTATLPVVTQPIVLDGFTQPGSQPNTNPSGGLNTVLEVELIGGLSLRGGSTTIRGVVANDLRFEGPAPTSQPNAVEGCFIGTDATGTQDRSTGRGVWFRDTGAAARVGGEFPGQRNLISGNETGIEFRCADNVAACQPGSLVNGNLIGTTVSGTAGLPNDMGIAVRASGNLEIGLPSPSHGNVISGNNLFGIHVEGGNTLGEVVRIQGNRIGVDDSGTLAIPNTGGVVVAGVQCQGCTPPRVVIGGGASTANRIAHNLYGVQVGGGVAHITHNTISDNEFGGIELFNYGGPIDDSLIWQNTITSNRGSGISGDTYDMAVHILENDVRSNGQNGIQLRAPAIPILSHAWIESNSISGNVRLGIDLGGLGVTPNDPLDQDSGPNDFANYPVLTSACAAGGTLEIAGTLHTEPSANVVVEFFGAPSCDPSGYGEGDVPLGSASAVTDVGGNAAIVASLNATVTPGSFITSTATLVDNSPRTSELSRCIQVFPPAPPAQAVTGPASVCLGSPFILSGVAGAISYQWFRNGTPIPGATGVSYGRPTAAPGDAGTYTVQATNCGGSGTSATHALGVVTCADAPVRLDVDAHAGTGTTSDLNRILEPGETALIEPRYRNDGTLAQTLSGTATLTGPAPGIYALPDSSAAYGSVAPGQTTDCFGATGDCYRAMAAGSRPQAHWDARFVETTTGGDPPRLWSLHLGDSFGDVPRANPFYRFVETIVHNAVTGGCSASSYCPLDPATREQMAVFVLVGREGPFYSPPACDPAAPRFADVPASSPFCPWIEELARRQVSGGCGGNNYCPSISVPRQQLAVFVLATREAPGYMPPACVAGAERFTDVPASSGFCRWIEELARRGVVTGCSNGMFCPVRTIDRGEMSVFLTVTFGLLLYGP